MGPGSVAVPQAAPQQNDGAPSAVSFVVGSPSPAAKDLTQRVQAGNSFPLTFGDFVEGLQTKVVSAVTSVSKSAKYKGDVVLGTISKAYNQTVAGAYGAVADTGTAVISVAKKVETGSTLLVLAIAAFLLFPYIIALRKK